MNERKQHLALFIISSIVTAALATGGWAIAHIEGFAPLGSGMVLASFFAAVFAFASIASMVRPVKA